MREQMVELAMVMDGAIVEFVGSAQSYMKVSNLAGGIGVVRLQDGLYIPASDLEKEGLEGRCSITYSSSRKMYFEEGD